jgi:hypothetical protein
MFKLFSIFEFYSLILHPVAREIQFNHISTTLHVSAYMQAIIRDLDIKEKWLRLVAI